MENTEIMRRFIHQEVVKALVNSRLDYDHPIGGVLEGEAQIVGKTACVRVVNDHGDWMMLEDRVKELMADPRFRDTVPNPATVAKGDVSGLRDSFANIAEGTAVVE
jgi:hypothetical protein